MAFTNPFAGQVVTTFTPSVTISLQEYLWQREEIQKLRTANQALKSETAELHAMMGELDEGPDHE